MLVDFWTYSCINCRTRPTSRRGTAIGQRADDHRSAHPGVRLRDVEAATCAGRRRASGVPGRSVEVGQRLRHVERLWQPVLAGRVPHRRDGQDPPRLVRRRRLRPNRVPDPHVARRRSAEAHLGVATKVADATPTERLTPETYLGYKRMANTTASASRPDNRALPRVPEPSRRTASPTGPVDGRSQRVVAGAGVAGAALPGGQGVPGARRYGHGQGERRRQGQLHQDGARG